MKLTTLHLSIPVQKQSIDNVLTQAPHGTGILRAVRSWLISFLDRSRHDDVCRPADAPPPAEFARWMTRPVHRHDAAAATSWGSDYDRWCR